MGTDYTVVTPRLRLEALTYGEIEALTHGERAPVARRLGAAIPAEWPGERLQSSFPLIAAAMTREEGDARWVWVVIEPRLDRMGQDSAARLIGDIGFFGPLLDGTTAEIGYVLIPDARGRGYVTEATAALIAWVFAHTGVAGIIAQIAPDNAASLRVAAKLGMREREPLLPEYRCFGITRPPAL